MLQMKTFPLGAYQTNCYVLWNEGNDKCLVIDPGYEPDYILTQLRLLGKQVGAILLTHGHFDHVGAVKGIAEVTGCPVYLCEEDLSMPHQFTAGPLYHTDSYREGSLLELADLQLKVLHTPGHTPGSVCLLCEGHLFAGDTLFRESCGRTDLPGGDWAQMLQSLRRLKTLPEETKVFPGHGPHTTIGEEIQWNPYMR